MKKLKTHKREDDDEEGSRPVKQHDYSFPNTPSQSSSPSTTGISSDFDRLQTTASGGYKDLGPTQSQMGSSFATQHPGPRYTTQSRELFLRRDNDNERTSMYPPLTRQDSIRITPPGPLDPDPIVRSDPRGMATVPRILPEQSDGDESDVTDYEEMTTKQKAKYNNNKAVEREQDRRMAIMHRLDLPIPSFWDVIKRVGHYKRDNNMHNMLSGDFYVSRRDNTVYHRLHQHAQVALDARDMPDEGSVRTKHTLLHRLSSTPLHL